MHASVRDEVVVEIVRHADAGDDLGEIGRAGEAVQPIGAFVFDRFHAHAGADREATVIERHQRKARPGIGVAQIVLGRAAICGDARRAAGWRVGVDLQAALALAMIT